MAIKLLWIDVETTGLDPKVHEIIQLAGLFEIPGGVKEEFNYRIRPTKWKDISEEALKINRISMENLRSFPPASLAYHSFLKMLLRWTSVYNPYEKVILCGQNVNFDYGFMKSFFKANGNDEWSSYVMHGKLELMTLAVLHELKIGDRVFQSHSLSSICEYLGVDINGAHDAMVDIKATRECIKRLLKW